jgi:hypothetical protein
MEIATLDGDFRVHESDWDQRSIRRAARYVCSAEILFFTLGREVELRVAGAEERA